MTKNLLRLTVAIIMAVFVKGAALAETTVYGIVSGSLNDKVVSFDFDALDPEGVTTPTFTNVQELPDVVDELCGVSVGNYFYAYYYDANYSLNFGTINFSTGTVTSINKFSVSNSPEVSAMALDAESGEVYGISTGFNDETGKQESRLVKVNTADGSTTVLQTMAKLNNAAIVSDNAGGFYLFGCKISSSFQYYPVVKHVDATGAITDVFGDQSIKLSGTTFNCAYRAAKWNLCTHVSAFIRRRTVGSSCTKVTPAGEQEMVWRLYGHCRSKPRHDQDRVFLRYQLTPGSLH